MPEGPEIKRAADQIAKAILHHPIQEAFFAFDHLKPYAEKLQGQKSIAVQARGKALLIRFENLLNIYSHNQLYGKWVIRKAYSYPETNRQLRMALHTEKKSALLYSASEIQVLSESEIETHPFLSRLGVDVLDLETTIEQVVAQLQNRKFHKRGLPSLLLDQGFLCGLGNYLRSEILFVAQVPPTHRPIDCSPTQLMALAQAALTVPQQSYRHNGITNDLHLAETLKQQGKRRYEYRHFVFSRENQPCFICGTAIVKTVLAGRRLYYCPTCQGESREIHVS